MWSDNETVQDLLGFRVHADLIKDLVVSPNLLPLTIGIFGDWGGGKTSIMKMIEQGLLPEGYDDPKEKAKYEKVACIYFNGWLFEGYDDAKAAILTSILLQLGEHARFGPKVRDNVVALIKSVNWMRVARMGFQNVALPAISAYLTGGASLVPTLAGKALGCFGKETTEKEGSADVKQNKAGETSKLNWETLIKKDETLSGPMDVRTFRERFGQMVTDSEIDSLVVLIDDLDRCSPERIIDNLEAIKLFLNVDKTAFIIGADPRIVRHAIAERYRVNTASEAEDANEKGNNLINDYLEKLIQVPYYLPRLSPSEIETYMVLLFCLKDLDSAHFHKCIVAFENQREKNRYAAFKYSDVVDLFKGERLAENFLKSLSFCSVIASMVTEGLKGNPRQVKRFLNAFILRKKLAGVAKLSNIQDEVLVKLMVLEYAHYRELRQLYEWQASQDGFPKEIKELEKALLPPDGKYENKELAEKVDKGWATPFMRKWLIMEPRLSDIDLRDYFWVVRDRLESTLSGLSLISPIVRRLVADLISGDSAKMNQAAGQVKDLDSEEVATLMGLISKHVLMHPDQKSGYDGFRKLVEDNVDNAANEFADVLIKSPASSVPPAVGIDILNLIRAKNNLQKVFNPIIEHFKTTRTKISTAIKKQVGE